MRAVSDGLVRLFNARALGRRLGRGDGLSKELLADVVQLTGFDDALLGFDGFDAATIPWSVHLADVDDRMLHSAVTRLRRLNGFVLESLGASGGRAFAPGRFERLVDDVEDLLREFRGRGVSALEQPAGELDVAAEPPDRRARVQRLGEGGEDKVLAGASDDGLFGGEAPDVPHGVSLVLTTAEQDALAALARKLPVRRLIPRGAPDSPRDLAPDQRSAP